MKNESRILKKEKKGESKVTRNERKRNIEKRNKKVIEYGRTKFFFTLFDFEWLDNFFLFFFLFLFASKRTEESKKKRQIFSYTLHG